MMQDSLVKFQELALGSRLKRLSDTLMKEVSIIYQELAIDFDPYHMPIFKIISEQNNLTVGEISNLLNVTQPAATQYINILYQKKMIVCHVCKLDKRKKKVSLSAFGKIMLEELQPIWKVIDAELKALTHNSANKSLLDHITYIENEIKKESLSSKIILNIKS